MNGYNNTAFSTSGATWEVRHKLDSIVRSDLNKINSSPVTLMSPIIELPAEIQYVINIPSTDPDGDVIKCRWASWDKKECAG